MKSFSIFNIFFVASLLVPYQEEVSGQPFNPMYGGAPMLYDNHGDDDLGLLLTVLLLATRNRNGPNCNCCNCCNCGGGSKNIPIPYPIPFPTNNPIINNRKSGYNDDDTCQGSNASTDQSYKDQSSLNYTLSYVPVPIGQAQSQDYGS